MKKERLLTCLLVLLVVSFSGIAQACTTFCLKHEGQWVFGKNLDWMVEKGLVVVNKRNVAKASLPDSGAVQWLAKYGSVTFNMYGRELPQGGMNERGLVIENLWLKDTAYPAQDSRPEINCLQWIQYQLDTAATVDDVISSDPQLRITPSDAPLHFLLCDAKGGCATIEFLGGKMVCHSGESLPVVTLTNSTYDESLAYLKSHAASEPKEAYCSRENSLGRFCKAALMIEDYDAEKNASPVKYAFAALDSVSNETTQWSVVYEPGAGRIHFRNRSNRDIRNFALKKFDFFCLTPVKVLDMLKGTSGEVSKAFVDYTYELNYDLVSYSFSNTAFLKDTPEETLRAVAAIPDLTQCVK